MSAFFRNKIKFLYLLLFFAHNAGNITAQSIQKAENILANPKNNQWSFEENRGQLADENGVVLKDIKYYGRDKGVAVYLRKNKISFVFSKTEPKDKPAFSEATGAINSSPFKNDLETPEEVKISTSRIDLEIIGANPETQILAEEKITYYTNYYLAHTPEEGITHVPHFKKITYKNIYSNIDLVLHVKDKGLKYEFVVHPKGKVSDIKLSWNGTKPDVLQNGGVKYASTFGEITESAPFTFISEKDGKEVKSAFKVKGNTIGFEIENYDESKKLVIDPYLIWGTYYGGGGYDEGYDIAVDKHSNLYITGGTPSVSGIATSDAHQTVFSGGFRDAFISKFNCNGLRLWGTYYGGDHDDRGYSISVDGNSDVYVTGFTNSTSKIATSGAHQNLLRYQDAFVAKFDNNGFRKWGTYYGGNNDDYGYGISTDSSGNVYITGITGSTTGIATTGSHQATFGGFHDAFVVKFNGDGVRQWGTYYGGNGFEIGYGVSTDGNGNVYITGYTESTSGITTQGAHQNTLGGNKDGFIAKFNSNGIMLWGTYYGGNAEDICYDITNDDIGNIYITGITQSPSGIASTAAHQPTYGGWRDALIVKFNSNGIRQWGTYYGGDNGDYSRSIYYYGNSIYITGYTYSKSGIATKDTHRPNYNGGYLAIFVAKVNSYGVRQWGTYYGEGAENYGYGVTYSANYVYITGLTNGTGIATSGAHQTTNGGGDGDAFISKFGILSDAGVVKINSPLGNKCGGNYATQVRIKNFYNTFNLDSCKIGWSVNGINQKAYNWKGLLKPGDTSITINIGSAYFKGGNNTLKVWTFNPNGGDDINNSNDTLTKTIYFFPTPEAKTGGNKSICIGESAIIGADSVPGNTYTWTSNPPGTISSQSKLTVTPAITTTYYLKETNTTSGCTKEDSVTITVYPIPDPLILGDTFICGQGTATFETNSNNPGSVYTWEAEGGSIISGQATYKISIKIDKATTTGKIKVTEQNLGGCSTTKEQAFLYNYSPLVDLGLDQYICEDYGNLVKLDAGKEYNTYLWYPTGDTTQYIIVKKVNDYYVVVTDQCGNEMKDEVKVASNCPVTIYIPNTFTPNKDLLNEVFHPLIENVTEYHFSIYNRWGERVFISTDYNKGWDGTYRDKAPTEGIYLWILECTVKEGAITRKLNKSGTVNLIR